MTAATPMTTPSSVRTDLSLLAHSESRAMRIASVTLIGTQSGWSCSFSVYQCWALRWCILSPPDGSSRHSPEAPSFRWYVAEIGKDSRIMLLAEQNHETVPVSMRLPAFPERRRGGRECARFRP